MFDGESGDFDIQNNHINDKGEIVISSGVSNRGVIGKTDIQAKIISKNSLTIDMFGNIYARDFNYKLVTHARVFALIPKYHLSIKILNYLASSLFYLPSIYNYNNMATFNKVKDIKIQLPTKNDEIDFEFMEDFIEEIEYSNVIKLEAYLNVTGLKDYELTDKEKQVIDDYKNGLINLIELKISDIFNVSSSNKVFDANKVQILSKGYPYVVRTANNNGIRGYLNEDNNYLNDGNTISFGQDTATMFYQKNPYFTGDKIKILKSKFKEFNKYSAQYFISAMSKAFSAFTWGAFSFSEATIKEQKIFVKIKDGKIDFEFMEDFIRVIQKLVIKDVVIYVNNKEKALKKVVKKGD